MSEPSKEPVVTGVVVAPPAAGGAPPSANYKPGGPKGKWSSGLCSCFDHCCTCLMACCCDPCLNAQMYEKQDPVANKGKCMQITGAFICLWLLVVIFGAVGSTSSAVAAVSNIFYCIFGLAAWALVWLNRRTIRHKDQIPEQTCNCIEDCSEDCCCTFWCTCCVTAQLARHEYEDVETGTIKYACDKPTGVAE
mmetsp:Transcript_21220/g.63334  ORF Transcript_21220/g.63334 Transcript_21220/m.63334 type:complete len:193 (-) Transcript_21220:76-654(-)|eukprot:CAMPEP_0119259388 /NCGR_PEP_ID=MMETSP1329-20130426/225_1 /TAXON_ID=114041 /ORGANISM="Genus nov. species nov., Strain RCC1024" /LENGTH=192 /DNA_ID=CAMNT_0007258767 /DNA_START=79 /DNA_END=657 /DNA_ORIENTATION=+